MEYIGFKAGEEELFKSLLQSLKESRKYKVTKEDVTLSMVLDKMNIRYLRRCPKELALWSRVRMGTQIWK